jgi:hypothetical protein
MTQVIKYEFEAELWTTGTGRWMAWVGLPTGTCIRVTMVGPKTAEEAQERLDAVVSEAFMAGQLGPRSAG